MKNYAVLERIACITESGAAFTILKCQSSATGGQSLAGTAQTVFGPPFYCTEQGTIVNLLENGAFKVPGEGLVRVVA